MFPENIQELEKELPQGSNPRFLKHFLFNILQAGDSHDLQDWNI